jgi:hypothetical protein
MIPLVPSPAPDPAHAFRALSARLAARRAASLGVRLWVVSAVLVSCVAAFTYWRVRVPLDGVVRHFGTTTGAAMLAAVLAACAVAGGVLAATRQVALAAAPPGPEWLALPLAPVHVERHLAREACLPALTVFVPAAAAWLAGFGLLGLPWLGLLALAFPLVWWLVARGACWATLRVASRATGPARRLPAAWRAIVSARRASRVRNMAPAGFRSEARWRALARLDRMVSWRAGSPRARLGVALLFLGLSVAAWGFGSRDPLETRAQAFAAFMLACTGLGAWAAWRAAGDPPAAVRSLPLALADAWRARAVPLLLAIGIVLALQAVVAAPLPALMRLGLVVTWLLPALLVTLLGLHLGLSLPGTPTPAENIYYSWLGVGLLSSVAIPLFGWGVLIGGFVHATRRIGHWYRPEVG